MPWKESYVRDERIRFVIRLKGGESMAAVPRVSDLSQNRLQDLSVMKNAERGGSRIVSGAPTAMLTDCLRNSKRPS